MNLLENEAEKENGSFPIERGFQKTENELLADNRKSMMFSKLLNAELILRNVKETEKPTPKQDKKCSTQMKTQFEADLKVLKLVTESNLTITQINGQRKLGPPAGWKGPPPGQGCEVFVGKIPRTVYENELYPVFSQVGEIYEIRLMMDFSGTNRGYAFIMYTKHESAKTAISRLNNYEIRPGCWIGVVASVNNSRLCITQIPIDVDTETTVEKIYKMTDEVEQVAIYRNRNREARYILISYQTHRGAAMARRRLIPERGTIFNGVEISVDWAHPNHVPIRLVSTAVVVPRNKMSSEF